MSVVFTKHAEKSVKALKGTPDANLVLNLLDGLEAGLPTVRIRSATEDLGESPVPEVDIREATFPGGIWRVIFTETPAISLTEDKPAPNKMILSIQKVGPQALVDFKDVFASVITEVSSTATSVISSTFVEEVSELVPEPDKDKTRDD